MSERHDGLTTKSKEWFAYAERDLAGAKHLLGMSGDAYPLVAYHAQRAARKALKAFLVWKDHDFPLTHDIPALRELCACYGEWPLACSSADELTNYVVTARYPGLGRTISKAQADRSIGIAEQVLQSVTIALDREGFKC